MSLSRMLFYASSFLDIPRSRYLADIVFSLSELLSSTSIDVTAGTARNESRISKSKCFDAVASIFIFHAFCIYCISLAFVVIGHIA